MEINDTIMHRIYVMRSGNYLAKYLIYKNRNIDAISLISRCSVHDISKIQNIEEFLSLASIIEEISSLKDVTFELQDDHKEAIRLHWKNNSHHPEHYKSPNDMDDLDLMEMACDCHARSKQFNTNLLEYIAYQQEKRFHFDQDHYDKLIHYCKVLYYMTRNDDYKSCLSQNFNLQFNLRDQTMKHLLDLDNANFKDTIATENLILEKKKTSGFATIAYSIYLKNGTKIGSIYIKCNGTIDYKIYEGYDEYQNLYKNRLFHHQMHY